MLQNSQKLRFLLSDILRGYSLSSWFKNKVFIKHLNNLDLAEIDFYNNQFLQEAINLGIPTYEEKVEYLIKNELWSKKEEEKIKDYKNQISIYELNKNNEFLKSKRKVWEIQLNELNKDIKLLEFKKNQLIGEIAESFANKKSNELHILYSFFKDKELNQRYFTKEEFGDLNEEEIKFLFNILNNYLSDFKQDNIKKIALSGFFLNMFYLSSENIYEFYGKPVVDLTFYQADLFQFGKVYINILSEFPNLPKDIMSDPDKIIEYVELNKNYKKMFFDKEEGSAGTIVGANKDDLAILGIESKGNELLQKELKKKGGRLTKEDLMRLSGE